MIELKHITKTFKAAKRNAGFAEAAKALFRKEYTYIHALQDVSFTVGDGEMVGYIGPNGAGKSSTIKIMSGILTPDSGECIINGRTPWKDRIDHVQEIGVAVFTGLFILYAGISFFTLEGLEFMNIFTDGSREFGKYPLSIYGEGVLKLCTCVIPIALFQYYPLLYLIGRSDQIGLIFLPLLDFLFILPCYGFFRFGLRKYQSTGS